MDKPWTEIFRSKGSVYALEDTTKDWLPRGTSGTVIVLQNPAHHQDVRIKFEKNVETIWWRLTASHIKPKGERALVLKAWAVQLNHQEILAIRFSDEQSAIQFANKYHDIYPMEVSHNIATQNIFSNNKSNAKNMIVQNPYVQPYTQRNHRMSNPPPAPSRVRKPPPPRRDDVRLEHVVNVNMIRHYSEPMLVQPAANQRIDHNDSWKCAVCTFKNQCTADVCSMCGANGAHDAVQAMMDDDDDMFGDPITGKKNGNVARVHLKTMNGMIDARYVLRCNSLRIKEDNQTNQEAKQKKLVYYTGQCLRKYENIHL
eukprot:437460_1